MCFMNYDNLLCFATRKSDSAAELQLLSTAPPPHPFKSMRTNKIIKYICLWWRKIYALLLRECRDLRAPLCLWGGGWPQAAHFESPPTFSGIPPPPPPLLHPFPVSTMLLDQYRDGLSFTIQDHWLEIMHLLFVCDICIKRSVWEGAFWQDQFWFKTLQRCHYWLILSAILAVKSTVMAVLTTNPRIKHW